jgi:hypothetical protein
MAATDTHIKCSIALRCLNNAVLTVHRAAATHTTRPSEGKRRVVDANSAPVITQVLQG